MYKAKKTVKKSKGGKVTTGKAVVASAGKKRKAVTNGKEKRMTR